jgi:hypothetical protein
MGLLINNTAVSCKLYFSLVYKIIKLSGSSMTSYNCRKILFLITLFNVMGVHEIFDFHGGQDTYCGHLG